MPWPLSQDYNEAIQNPSTAFADAELKQGEAVTNALGLPQPCSGNFADVYAVQAGNRKWAVKCFTRQIPACQERYVQISKYLQQVKLPFMVEFSFLEKGIQVRGSWYPVLKMQWVEGFALNTFVRDNVDKPQVLQMLGQIWVRMAARLREATLAHCDLQHGNVLLVPGSKAGALGVKLVDYDGMCVPALELLKSIELGHANFQHPQRLKEGSYGLEIDRFPHLAIYTALRALSVGGKGLWEKYDTGDNLLFTQKDFAAPTKSPLFAELFKLNDAEVKKLAGALMLAAQKPIDEVPLLDELVEAKAAAKPQAAPVAVKPAAPIAENVFAAATGAAPAGRRTKYDAKKKSSAGVAIAAGIGAVVLIGGIVAFATMRGSPASKGEAVAEVHKTQASRLTHESTKRERPTLRERTGTRSQSKVEPNPEPPVEPKKEPKDEPPVEPKKEPKDEPKSVLKVEPKPEPKVDPEPVTKPKMLEKITNSIGMKLMLIPRGKFTMGSPLNEPGHRADEEEHQVVITKPFYLGAHEVTVAQFRAFVKASPSYKIDNTWENPGWPQTDKHPVINVTWFDAAAFCEWLSKKEGRKYRLPTEAEWEYACRAGMKTAWYFGNEAPTGFVWYNANSGGHTNPVGQLKANAWGLYDMHGNAWEWTADWFDPDYYKKSPKEDPTGPSVGGNHVMRGGAWSDAIISCRTACRSFYDAPSGRSASVGFRVVLVPQLVKEAEVNKEPGPQNLPKQITNSIRMKLALIPSGTSQMGSPATEPGRWEHEGPQHEVIISKSFYMGMYKVTVGQFKAFVKDAAYQTEAEKSDGAHRRFPDGKWAADPKCNWQNPGFEQTDAHPVVCVSWNDATAFCAWLSKKEGKEYALPTEAQWEYSCRAGSRTKYYFGDGDAELAQYAWFASNAGLKTHPGGQKKPNAWGLYDMHGNAWEWTADWFNTDYYKDSPKRDPLGPTASSGVRAVRGGGWDYGENQCRSAYRIGNRPPSSSLTNLGFRVVLLR